MKKTLALLALSATVSFCARAQDKLYLKTGKTEQVKVTEITDRAIRYKMYDNPEGPEYVVDKSRVLRVVYENGTEDIFNTESAAPPPRERRERVRKPSLDYGRHFVGANLSDLFRTDATIHYEYVFPNNRIALRVPVTVGFVNNFFNVKSHFENPYVFRRNRVFETGLDFRFYPGGQGKVRYVMGPALHYILNNKRGPLMGSVPVGNHHVNTIRWMLYNGIVFTPTDHFRFGFDVGLGSQYDLSDTRYTDERVFGDPKVQFNWYMGAKF